MHTEALGVQGQGVACLLPDVIFIQPIVSGELIAVPNDHHVHTVGADLAHIQAADVVSTGPFIGDPQGETVVVDEAELEGPAAAVEVHAEAQAVGQVAAGVAGDMIGQHELLRIDVHAGLFAGLVGGECGLVLGNGHVGIDFKEGPLFLRLSEIAQIVGDFEGHRQSRTVVVIVVQDDPHTGACADLIGQVDGLGQPLADVQEELGPLPDDAEVNAASRAELVDLRLAKAAVASPGHQELVAQAEGLDEHVAVLGQDVEGNGLAVVEDKLHLVPGVGGAVGMVHGPHGQVHIGVVLHEFGTAVAACGQGDVAVKLAGHIPTVDVGEDVSTQVRQVQPGHVSADGEGYPDIGSVVVPVLDGDGHGGVGADVVGQVHGLGQPVAYINVEVGPLADHPEGNTGTGPVLGQLRIRQVAVVGPAKQIAGVAEGLDERPAALAEDVKAQLLPIGELHADLVPGVGVAVGAVHGLNGQVHVHEGPVEGGGSIPAGGQGEDAVVAFGQVPALAVRKDNVVGEGGQVRLPEGVLHLLGSGIGHKGLKAHLSRHILEVGAEVLHGHQLVVDEHVGVAAHPQNGKFQPGAAGVEAGFAAAQLIHGVPVVQGRVGKLAVLDHVLAVVPQQVRVPGSAVGEDDAEAGPLLGAAIAACGVLGQQGVEVQVRLQIEAVVALGGKHIAVALVADNAVILVRHVPGVGVGGKEIIFHRQFRVNIPIQCNGPGQGLVALLFHGDGVVALGQVLQGELAVLVQGDGLFALRSLIADFHAVQAVAAQPMEQHLAGEGLVARGNGLRLGGDGQALVRSLEIQGHGAVLIIRNFMDVLLPVHQDGGQGVALVGRYRHHGIHAGQGRLGTGEAVMLARYPGHRHGAHHALAVEAEVVGEVAPANAVLHNEGVPGPVHVGVGPGVVIGGDVGHVHMDIFLLHLGRIDAQVVQIIPGNEELHGVALAVLAVHFPALGGHGQPGHNVVGGGHVGKAVAVPALHGQCPVGLQVNFKGIFVVHAGHAGHSQIHFDAAVHEAAADRIHINGGRLGDIIGKIQTVFAEPAGRRHVHGGSTVFIVEIEPVVVLIDLFVQLAVQGHVLVRRGQQGLGVDEGVLAHLGRLRGVRRIHRFPRP